MSENELTEQEVNMEKLVADFKVVIADAEGVVHRSFLGTVSATHLWAAVAEARDPGSAPPGCGEHD